MAVEEIKTAIESLSQQDYVLLRKWFSEKDWEKWDTQIEEDSKNGKLDFLLQDASDARANKNFKAL